MYQKNTGKGKNSLYTVPAVIIFVILYLIRGNTFEDDAYIFYRYAENWASGYGLVYNIGEYVEGYSSLLWTAILAAGAFFSSDLVELAPFLNLIIGILCFFLVSHISSLIAFSKPRLMAVVLPLFCALSYGFYYYSASGMDTLILSLILLLSILVLYKSKDTGDYLIALLSLILLNIVRVEGFIYSIILLAVLTYSIFKEYKKMPKQLYVLITAFLGLTILLFVMRYSIYNEWMPATVSAKGFATYSIKKALFTGDYQAMKNFIRVILSGLGYEFFLLPLGAWIPFVVLLARKNKSNVLLWLIASSIAVNVFVSVWAGGDYMPYKRHFVPVLPLLVILIAWAVDGLFCQYWRDSLYKKLALIISGILLLFLWAGFFIKPTTVTKKYFPGSEHTLYLREIGTLLRDISAPTTVLSNMIGELSYYAGPRVYIRDILGLTDIHNAKYGDVWGFNWGKGACGRTDFTYSFTTPFDIFFYNSTNMHKRFISFCEENPSLCEKYRFLKSEKWPKSYFYIVINIDHPVFTVFKERFDVVSIPISEDLYSIVVAD